MSDIGVERFGHVTVLELQRPPHNFTDVVLMRDLADRLDDLAAGDDCRAVVLASQGRSFSAGANFAAGGVGEEGSDDGDAHGFGDPTRRFYDQALRLFEQPLPLVAAVHGPAVGAGAGLALACDLRVGCPEAWIGTTFVRLGLHPGFGISVTLPHVVGPAVASDLLLTGRRVHGEEAGRIGLLNRVVPKDRVRQAAIELATEIAAASPLAVRSTRDTQRAGLADRVREILHHELAEQARLSATEDGAEGIRASLERREPRFTGR